MSVAVWAFNRMQIFLIIRHVRNMFEYPSKLASENSLRILAADVKITLPRLKISDLALFKSLI